MFINLFIYSDDEENAKKIVNDLLQNERQYINKIEYKRFEPYWKFDDMFEIGFEVQFNEDFTQNEFAMFLENISDKWTDYGDSVLASDTTEGCNYIKGGIGLINIIYDE